MVAPPSLARAAACLCALGLLAGCAGLPPSLEAPRVSLAGLRLIDVTVFEQRYEVGLRIRNPNPFALAVNGMSYELYLNEREFATGVSPRPVEVPAFDERLVWVEVVSDLGRVIEQVQALEERRAVLAYRIAGRMRIEGYWGTVPFEHSGELAGKARGAP
ncbi:MAG: LEA type 2 family protein [Gammaproteobacteria bacterium]|nr:LEA type 2 family protein [Gammaproteobacteria bacterium]NIR99064.1 LEA type 2 family protein [Gammaproteobacteria bacterium]NIT64696.1 LEA type 2 family protein [Gammaproteobacteria bacterium]NIV21654.1 hypothetical protein [Gammaproteobacteria bacterium]NIX10616.1 hypothetical protein [Gammaproteobacteria bacterium]